MTESNDYDWQLNSRISSQLKRYIRSRGLTNTSLADQTGLTKSKINSVINGHLKLERHVADQLALILKLKINYENGEVKSDC